MQETTFLYTYDLNMTMTLGLAVILLYIGHFIKKLFPILTRYFIPSPVLGGIIFSIVTLIGHQTHTFSFTYDEQLKNLLMIAFFTTIGFTASFKMLISGGLGVALFLVSSIILIVIQNGIGVGIAELFGESPLLGMAAGSIPLTGGHGTSAAFGPELQRYGLEAGLTVSIAAATFGLVAGSIIGGPVGERLIAKYHCKSSDITSSNADMVEGKLTPEEKTMNESHLLTGCAYIIISMVLGSFIIMGLKKIGVILPAYIGPMIIASIIRNYFDLQGKHIPIRTINVIGSLSLQYFLAMALMTMRLWELIDLAIPLFTILIVQTIVMALFAYFITFRIMGKDYDAAVICVGQCGFGMGATPNAMANMSTFTGGNGPSPKAFFVVPMVGALFIDFVNAFIITMFLQFFA
jgi:ESS family glutamate:Na+ symporter